ncbi:hypothetical protein M758_10G132700 [Ceratodon purpureus]|nr:hypothetical protein M758_10G132700 [Ceratodon purpureus]
MEDAFLLSMTSIIEIIRDDGSSLGKYKVPPGGKPVSEVLDSIFMKHGLVGALVEDASIDLTKSDLLTAGHTYTFQPENLAKALSGPPAIMRRYKEQAPSSFDLHTVRRVQNHVDGPLFRCDRSHLGTLPGPLLHPIFGEFEDNLQNSTLLTREDHSFVKELCDTST